MCKLTGLTVIKLIYCNIGRKSCPLFCIVEKVAIAASFSTLILFILRNAYVIHKVKSEYISLHKTEYLRKSYNGSNVFLTVLFYYFPIEKSNILHRHLITECQVLVMDLLF